MEARFGGQSPGPNERCHAIGGVRAQARLTTHIAPPPSPPWSLLCCRCVSVGVFLSFGSFVSLQLVSFFFVVVFRQPRRDKTNEENTDTQTPEPRVLTIERYSSQTNTALVSSHACICTGKQYPNYTAHAPSLPTYRTECAAQGSRRRETAEKRIRREHARSGRVGGE